MGLHYPVEVFMGEHEVGDAYLAVFTDFDIKGSGEEPEEAIAMAQMCLRRHIARELEKGKALPKPREGVRFMQLREALKAYKAKDYIRAHELWSHEANFKNDQAMTNLGLLYLKGEGVEKDYGVAKGWFEKASEYGNDSANYNLGLMYQTSIGVGEDIPKAIEYYRYAVRDGHQSAAFRLGLLLLKERTDSRLVAEGFDAMLLAARSGHPMAMAQIGGMDKHPDTDAKPNTLFRAKSFAEQQAVIEDALERYIRPILIKDGGNVMLLGLLTEPDIEIRLAYQGNCAGCSLGATNTYEMIRSTLTQVIDGNIRIYVL